MIFEASEILQIVAVSCESYLTKKNLTVVSLDIPCLHGNVVLDNVPNQCKYL